MRKYYIIDICKNKECEHYTKLWSSNCNKHNIRICHEKILYKDVLYLCSNKKCGTECSLNFDCKIYYNIELKYE